MGLELSFRAPPITPQGDRFSNCYFSIRPKNYGTEDVTQSSQYTLKYEKYQCFTVDN